MIVVVVVVVIVVGIALVVVGFFVAGDSGCIVIRTVGVGLVFVRVKADGVVVCCSVRGGVGPRPR